MFFDLQRANMLKRISALILDVILLMVLATGFGTLVSWISGYDAQYAKLNSMYESYGKEYGIRYDLSSEEYQELSDMDFLKYQKAAEDMADDDELNRTYSLVMSMSLMILSLGIFLAYAVLEFAVPLILGNGQTVGKRIFGISLMQTDHTKLRTLSLAIRTFLGKYAIETMVPLMIIVLIFLGSLGLAGTIALLGLLALQVGLVSFTKTNAAIHDLLGGTIAVDHKSQKIFKNLEELKDFRNKAEGEDRGL